MPPDSPSDPAAELLTPPNAKTSHRLFQLGCGGLSLALVALVYKSPIKDPSLLALGSIIVFFGVLPALNWARRSEAHFPIFEVFLATTVPFYGVSMLAGPPEAFEFSDEATLLAALAVVIFQATAILTYVVTKARPLRSPFLIETLIPDGVLRFAETGIWINTGYIYINGFTDLIPWEFRITVRSIFFGLGIVSLFIQMRRWGGGSLHFGEKASLTLNLIVQMILVLRDLYLITAISTLLVGLLSYVSTSRKLPLPVIILVVPFLGLLHNGKGQMRREYWEQHTPMPNLSELPAYFEKWIYYGLDGTGKSDEPANASLTGKLFERASLFQMLCLVTELTPQRVPNLDGESYMYIPVQIIPSFLWPGKPSSMKSNVLMAFHYGLVSEDSRVSIAFGMIAEAYANFGFLGCALIGCIIGYGYKRVTLAVTGCPTFSALGLFTILLGAWGFQAEQILATWIISLFQASIIVVGIPLAWRILFR